MTEQHFPVVIIGGGIVGLSASLFLSSHKIPHLLVERHATTSILPRARGINTRATELFRSVGVDEAIREAGAELAPSIGVLKGNSFFEVLEPRPRKEIDKKGSMPLAKFSDGVSPVVGARCAQDMMEPVLVRFARERGGQLRYNTELVSFEQDEDGVTATMRNRENDTTSTIHADYLIAADGAGSPIRKQLGIGTTGRGALGNLINIYFHADLADFVRGREISLCTVERPEVLGLLTAINNRDRWVFHLSYDPAKGEKAEDFAQERCENLLRIAIGIPDLKIEIDSMRPWQPSDLAAEKMSSGRIFLAGDAAHQTTPYAGQGATTGISDVWDLAWKLSFVFKGQASPKLLDTYEVERLPVGRFVAKESGDVADDRGLPDLRWGAITFILNGARRMPMYTGFGYHYTAGAIIPEPEPSRWIWWWSIPWTISSLIMGLNGRPGTRAPHVWVQHEGKRISTLDLFGKEFVLLAGSEGKSWCQAASELGTKRRIDLAVYRVGPTGDLSDPQRQWEYAACISSQGALLIRPDGFVAWRVQDQQGDLIKRLGKALDKILAM